MDFLNEERNRKMITAKGVFTKKKLETIYRKKMENYVKGKD